MAVIEHGIRRRATVGSYLSVSTGMMLSVIEGHRKEETTIKTLTILNVRKFHFIEMLQLTSLIPILDLTEKSRYIYVVLCRYICYGHRESKTLPK